MMLCVYIDIRMLYYTQFLIHQDSKRAPVHTHTHTYSLLYVRARAWTDVIYHVLGGVKKTDRPA